MFFYRSVRWVYRGLALGGVLGGSVLVEAFLGLEVLLGRIAFGIFVIVLVVLVYSVFCFVGIVFAFLSFVRLFFRF